MRRVLYLVALVAALALALVAPAAATLPTPTGEKFIINIGVTSQGDWWKANYFRNLPYTADTGWTDGDRCAYRTGYAFLTFEDEIVGRVSFVRVPGASYAIINDKYMKEGQRFYDGTLYTGPPVQELGDCPTVSQTYEPWTGPDERPTVTYETVGGDLLEVRDYSALNPPAGIKWRQTESSDSRVTVVAYFNDLPVVVIYYDSMTPDVVMRSDVG